MEYENENTEEFKTTHSALTETTYGAAADDDEPNDNDQQHALTASHSTADTVEDEDTDSPPPLPTATPKSKKARHAVTNLFLNGKNGSPTASGVKRKAVINVTMLEFVQLVLRIAVDVTIRGSTVNDAVIAPYIEELKISGSGSGSTNGVTPKKVGESTPSKRMKLCAIVTDSTSSSTVSNAEAKINEDFEKLPLKSKRTVYSCVVNALFVALEGVNATLHFSREHLKYFLATYQRSVTVSDFVDTNRLKNGGAAAKKQKTTSRLHNGAILVEYSKSPYMFASNLSRCESTDVEAIRFIVETGISLSSTLYRNLVWRLEDVEYTVDKIDTYRPDHVCIPIQNFKRAAVLISESVILLYDGTQFVLPTPNIERDITARMIASAQLKRKEYIVLDVLLANKLRVIDIIATNKQNFDIPEGYAERLQLITETLKDIKHVSLDEPKFDGSYIQKSMFSHNAPIYIHYKPNHTLAAIGVQNSTIYLAYQNDNGDLVYRLNTVNSGPASLVLGVVGLQDSNASESGTTTVPPSPPTISLIRDETVNRRAQILGLENEPDVRLFTRAICVELKDGNKLGPLSGSPITNVREYKPPAAPKDGNGTALSVENLTAFINDPNNLGNLIKAIGKSTQFDAIIKSLQTDTINLATMNLGY